MYKGFAVSGGGLVCWVIVTTLASNVMADVSPSNKDQGWYTIIGTKFLRHNQEYDCAVTVYPKDTSIPTTVTVEIVGKLEFNNNFNISQTSVVEPSTTKIFRLLVGNLSPGRYSLEVRGEGGLEFSNATILEVLSKSTSIFIQTDKAIYKPGTKVQFRILALDSNLKPTIKDDILVYILDGKGNRVKEWPSVKTKKGVWSGELHLSDNPVLGDWTIHVSTPSIKLSKGFEVAKLVLPKFEVTLNVPRNIGWKDAKKIEAHISARYTYGAPVKGEVTISAIKEAYYYGEMDVTADKILPFNGDAVVEFNLIRELDLGKWFFRTPTVKFRAVVEEELTGKKLDATALVTVHEFNYKPVYDKQNPYYHPGLKKTIFIKVMKRDGTLIKGAKAKGLSIKTVARYAYGYEVEASYDIHPSGKTTLAFYPPKNPAFFEVHVTIGVESAMIFFDPFKSPSNTYLNLFMATLNPKVNSDIEVEVNMTEHNPSLVYQVFGKGGVVLAGTLKLNKGETATTFKFPATREMAPKAQLLVYYLREDKEMVVDSISFDIDFTLPNFVEIESNVTESEPGGGIKLNIKAEPNSYIGLLGVDQRVLLLNKGNDIVESDVLSEVEAYGQKNNKYESPWGRNVSTTTIFELSNSFVLTNGLVYSHQSEVPKQPPELVMSNQFASPARADSLSNDSTTYDLDIRNKEYSYYPKPALRSNFLETWIWQLVDTDDNGLATLNATVPGTITSWVISAFSIDSSHGLGLTQQPTKIKVITPLFISLDLPYSIIRGETVTIPVQVFNYMDTNVTAFVSLFNDAGQFEFRDVTNSNIFEKVSFRNMSVRLQPNSGERTSFTITATELGYISFKVVARSNIATNAIERKLLVKAEGETQYKNEAVFVDLRKVDSFVESVTVDIPDNYVPDTSRIEVSVVGDILGTSLSNLDHLIRMPNGCGEQNMLNFVPNTAILDYLKNSNKLTPAIEKKCLKIMETGYQRELSYKLRDGSFSAFGNFDYSGNTWLTAFVLKSFASAEPYINISSRIIDKGLAWIARRQTLEGSFKEVGTIIHTNLQGRSGQGLALTSYCLLPFLAYSKPAYSSTVDKGLDYIVKQLDSISNDSYSLAISTYVLHLAQHPAKDAAFKQLQSNAHSARSMVWWKRAEMKSDKENPHAQAPNSVDVEMTAYALLTYLERGLMEDSMSIMNWLLTQQNANGGFTSAQDTVVALTALSKLASKLADEDPDITVTFSTDQGFSKDIIVNSDNSMVLQKLQIPEGVDKVSFEAKGHGLAVVQVSYSYNVDVTAPWPMFTLLTGASHGSDKNQFHLDICFSFMNGVERDEIKMVVLEITLPSGYVTDQDSLLKIKKYSYIKSIELQEANTHVVLYINQIVRNQVCSRIYAVKSHEVQGSKPVPVTVYDYYNQSRRARVFYYSPDCASCPQQLFVFR